MQLIDNSKCKGLLFAVMCGCIFLVACLNAFADDSGGSSTAKIVVTDGGSGGDTALPDLFTGAMSYSIPIEVPPGRKGMDPGIAMTYRSGNGSGWLGVGWELEVGSIQRSVRNGVDYTKNEFQLRMAGANIDLVSTGGGDYQVKIESGFARITQMSSLVDGQPYWVLTDKNGVKFTFGESAASRQDDTPGSNPARIYKWCLNRVEDPNGNYMTFTYFKDAPNGQIYLERIYYTGNVNGPLPVTNYVRFYLDAPYSSPDMYTTGFKVNSRYLLKTIEVRGNNSPVKAYKLSYRQSSSSMRPILTGLQEFGRDAVVDQVSGIITNEGSAFKKPAMSFDKLADGTGFSSSNSFAVTFDESDLNYLGDFNGDGKMDLLTLDSSGGFNRFINYSNGSNFITIRYSELSGNTSPRERNLVGDFDGDGKSDLFAVNTAAAGYVHYASSGFKSALRNSMTLSSATTGAWNLVGDFDGDGRADILAILSGTTASINYSTGNGFSATSYSGLQLNGTTAALNLVGDFDGDGKADILSIRTATSGYIHYAKNAFVPVAVSGLNFNVSGSGEWNRVGDFNGDGKADVLTMVNGTTAYVNYSTGSGFVSSGYATMQINTAGGGWNLVGDFNGDGRADLLALFPSTSSGYVQYSTGSGFNKIQVTGLSIRTDDAAMNVVGNFSGNGRADLLKLNNSSSCFNSSVATPDLTGSFANGLGGTTTVTYTPSTQYTNTLLPFPVQTVSLITSSDNNGNVSKTYFSYAGGYFHVGERDFRGFNEVSVWGPVSADGKQTRTTTYFHQGKDTEVDVNSPNVTDAYMKGKPYRKKVWGVSGVVNGNEPVTLDQAKLISETTTSYKPDADGLAPYFTPPLQVDNYLYDAGVIGRHTKSVYEFDGYGNMTREESHGDANDPPSDRTVTREYSYNLASHIVGLPYRESVYEGIGTTALKASTEYYYDDLTSCTATPTNNQTPYNGNLTRVRRWLDGGESPEQWTAYDSYGNVVCSRDPNSVRDPNGKFTSMTYDGTFTFPTIVTDPLQHSVSSRYYGVDGVPADKGGYGQKKSSTDANGAIRSYEYDSLGRKALETLPDGFATSWDYSGFPQYVKKSDSSQSWTFSYLDGFGRQWREERKGPDNKTIVTDTLYDARGAVRQKSLPYFKNLETPRYATYGYDPSGRTTTLLLPGTSTATRICYAPGVRVSIDQNNHRKRQTEDSFGRLVKVEEYLGTYGGCSIEVGSPYATTTYAYDVLGNLTQVTDAKANRTEMQYDSLGRKYYMKDPDMGEWRYDYDANGNLIQQTDAKQQKIRFGYDALGRLKSKDFGADGVIDVSYAYDEPASSYPLGRLTTMTDGAGSTKYHYDIAGRTSRTIRTIDGTSYQTSFGYELGRLKSITYPDNESVSYHYDPAGNLDQAIGYATFAGFNALGQPGSITYGNGVTTSYAYSPTNSRLQSIVTTSPTQGGLVNLAYEYYENGNIWKVTDNLSAAIPHNFVSESFTPHDSKPHAVGSVGSGRSFIYDDNGNMTSDGKRSVSYNAENMPTSIVSPSSSIDITYDGNGQRLKKSSPAGSRLYVGNLFECGDGICGKYIFAGDTRIALKRGGELFYYHLDHLGSTVAVTDGNGAVSGAPGNSVEAIAYYPFGETRSDSGSENLNHKYTSQEFDYETGLYNYNARLYDPELGRFVSADSIVPDPANPQSLNRYSYVINNPLAYTDPSGHDFWKKLGNFFKDILDSLCSDGCGGGVDSNGQGYAYGGTTNNSGSYNTVNGGSGGGGSNSNYSTSGNADFYYAGGDTAYGWLSLYASGVVANNVPPSAFNIAPSFGLMGSNHAVTASVGSVSDGSKNAISTESTANGVISFNGTLGGQIVPTIPGIYIGGGINVGLTSNGQVIVQAQANGMIGAGYYAGVGVAAGPGASNGSGLLPFYSVDRYLHVEGNAGWGGSVGYTIDNNKESLSVGKSLKYGAGYGVMQGVGISQTMTIAFPPLW